jgi:hypothetical protein
MCFAWHPFHFLIVLLPSLLKGIWQKPQFGNNTEGMTIPRLCERSLDISHSIGFLRLKFEGPVTVSMARSTLCGKSFDIYCNFLTG